MAGKQHCQVVRFVARRERRRARLARAPVLAGGFSSKRSRGVVELDIFDAVVRGQDLSFREPHGRTGTLGAAFSPRVRGRRSSSRGSAAICGVRAASPASYGCAGVFTSDSRERRDPKSPTTRPHTI